MSFFQKKMSQNDWATILPFGPVTLIFYWPKKKNFGPALISGTDKCFQKVLIEIVFRLYIYFM